MSTGAIIAIAIAVVLLLIVLLVVLPKARRKAEERKAEQERRERERRLERERQEAADHHRTQADSQRHQAELAEAEAKKQRAEAEINAKRAELHEQGLADDRLSSGAGNGRLDHDGDLSRDDGARRVTERPVESFDDGGRDRGANSGAVRDLSGGGRAHEPMPDGDATQYERGRERGREEVGGDGGGSGGRLQRIKDDVTDRSQDRRP